MFTCLVTRAVHLESANSRSSTDFVNSFNRFAAPRGQSSCVFSDNGSQFVVAKNALKMKWDLITPQASGKGGVYERLLGLV